MIAAGLRQLTTGALQPLLQVRALAVPTPSGAGLACPILTTAERAVGGSQTKDGFATSAACRQPTT